MVIHVSHGHSCHVVCHQDFSSQTLSKVGRGRVWGPYMFLKPLGAALQKKLEKKLQWMQHDKLTRHVIGVT
jgi:hypothetical protein